MSNAYDQPEIAALPRPVVRVTIPAEAAFSLDKLQKIVGNTMARLGCPGCTSGRDILIHSENEFVVNAKTLDVTGIR